MLAEVGEDDALTGVSADGLLDLEQVVPELVLRAGRVGLLRGWLGVLPLDVCRLLLPAVLLLSVASQPR